MKTKQKKLFRYLNSFDVKSSWAATLTIITATILLGFILYLGIIYTITIFGK